MTESDLTDKIKSNLNYAAEASCQCCQYERLKWLHDLGWEWIEVEGKHAKIRFGYQILNYRIEVFSRPGVLSTCMSSKGELEAPALDQNP